MHKRDARTEYEIIQDKGLACVDRGELIVKLFNSGKTQAQIADKANLSTTTISQLRNCFENLKGQARKMCKAKKINRDACFRLARQPVSDQAREVIIGRAIDLMKKRDDQRSAQQKSPKGRQTPRGYITDEDMKQAIKGYD